MNVPRPCWWRDGDSISDLLHAHDQLSTLTNNQVLSLQLSQVFGNSWSRSADEIGEVLVTERYSQKHAVRLLDSEIGSQFE